MVHDVVIVGAGPAGITLALELAAAGLRVALVESGGAEFDPDTQALYDGIVTGHDVIDLMAMRLRLLGGTSNHWAGRCLPMDAIDFRRRPLSGLSGWPFDRAHLDPFYARAHAYVRIGAFDYSREIAEGIGPSDLLLPRELRLQSAPLRRSPGPVRFGETYRAALDAAPTLDLVLNANAVGITLADDDRISGVELATLEGERRHIAGRAVVLACGAVETARQLMLANAAHGRRFGDAGGLLGRCYMDHPGRWVGVLHLAAPVPPKAYWRPDLRSAEGVWVEYVWRLSQETLEQEGLANAHFYLVPAPSDPAVRQRRQEAGRADRALRDIVKWTIGRGDGDLVLSEAYCRFITNADSFLAETVVHRGRVDRLVMRVEAEQLPARSNGITLSDSRDALGLPKPVLHWAPGDAERDSILRSATLIGTICGAAGLGRIELEEGFDEPFWGANTNWHQMGTTRMAANPRDGVTDPDGRVHGTRNLFVAGGAVMPSVGRANPTLTILALTIRLGDHLKREVAAL